VQVRNAFGGREGKGNGHIHKMEDDRLLYENVRAFTFGSVRAEDAVVSPHSIHHNAEDLDKEGVASPHGSLAKSESAESQKERTSVPHSPSKKQIHVRSVIMAYSYGPATLFYICHNFKTK
jgi:hypothetical protein